MILFVCEKRFETLDFTPHLNLLLFSFCPSFVCWQKRLSTRLLLDLNQWILWHNLLKRCWEQKMLKIKKLRCKLQKNFDIYGTYLSTLNLNCQVLLQFSRAVNFPCSQKHGGPRCWINFQIENIFFLSELQLQFLKLDITQDALKALQLIPTWNTPKTWGMVSIKRGPKY